MAPVLQLIQQTSLAHNHQSNNLINRRSTGNESISKYPAPHWIDLSDRQLRPKFYPETLPNVVFFPFYAGLSNRLTDNVLRPRRAEAPYHWVIVCICKPTEYEDASANSPSPHANHGRYRLVFGWCGDADHHCSQAEIFQSVQFVNVHLSTISASYQSVSIGTSKIDQGMFQG